MGGEAFYDPLHATSAFTSPDVRPLQGGSAVPLSRFLPSLRRRLTSPRRAAIVLVVIALVVATTERSAERYGDRLQVALPLMAWGCEALNGHAAEYLLRYVVMFTAAHGSKRLLGDAPFNIRPDGGGHGMPSAHTSTAVLGASSLVQECLVGHPFVQGVTIISAGFVGASRIEAERHDIWQVLAGALLGWGVDRAFRRSGRGRRAAARALRALGRLPRRRRDPSPPGAP
ncbi:MAG: phosphatase PAP2 family protein [Alphaproteobacteria bacterium]|nr:MAG: phosphatase PAP2 family protein [Alphaproteobacteria bacterium]